MKGGAEAGVIVAVVAGAEAVHEAKVAAAAGVDAEEAKAMILLFLAIRDVLPCQLLCQQSPHLPQ